MRFCVTLIISGFLGFVHRPQQTAQCVFSIPCERGRSYICETGRLLAVRLREHRHNLKEGVLEK
jgi:hypothetical protein